MATARAIKTVGVLGMGLMGTGIAQITAAAGIRVIGVEANPAAGKKSVDAIARSLAALGDKAVKKGTTDAPSAAAHVAASLARLTVTADRAALRECDVVVEAAPEDWAFKSALYRELRASVRPDAVLASNTSGLLIADLAREFGDAGRVIGLHYFNPVPLMALCEVATLPTTPPDVTATAFALVRAQGKTPVLCTDSPGFIVNRLLVPFIAQAVALHDRGVASVADIDAAMKLGTGHPMGCVVRARAAGRAVAAWRHFCVCSPTHPHPSTPPHTHTLHPPAQAPHAV